MFLRDVWVRKPGHWNFVCWWPPWSFTLSHQFSSFFRTEFQNQRTHETFVVVDMFCDWHLSFLILFLKHTMHCVTIWLIEFFLVRLKFVIVEHWILQHCYIFFIMSFFSGKRKENTVCTSCDCYNSFVQLVCFMQMKGLIQIFKLLLLQWSPFIKTTLKIKQKSSEKRGGPR